MASTRGIIGKKKNTRRSSYRRINVYERICVIGAAIKHARLLRRIISARRVIARVTYRGNIARCAALAAAERNKHGIACAFRAQRHWAWRNAWRGWRNKSSLGAPVSFCRISADRRSRMARRREPPLTCMRNLRAPAYLPGCWRLHSAAPGHKRVASCHALMAPRMAGRRRATLTPEKKTRAPFTCSNASALPAKA